MFSVEPNSLVTLCQDNLNGGALDGIEDFEKKSFTYRLFSLIIFVWTLGRYNKYSRTLPQTPWLIDNVRLRESSVEVMFNLKTCTVDEHVIFPFKLNA